MDVTLFLAIIFFLLGLALGSFFNVVILRLVAEQSISGRSHCPHCGTQLKWYDNIPLLSFIWLRGRCHYCHKHISWQYPLVELAAGLLWLVGYLVIASGSEALSYSSQGIASSSTWLGLAMTWGGGLAMTPAGWLAVITFGIFASFLLILFVFDLRWYILPDVITLSGLVAALALNFYLGKDWRWLVGATILGAAWFGFQYAVSRGKWVGSGDIRLGALIGAMLASWQGLVMALFGAYLLGSVVAIPLLVLKKKGLKSELPFGTFLTLTTLTALLWGDQIWQWYILLLW